MEEKMINQEEQSWLKLIQQSLHGVTFHNFKIDYYDLLGLCGFKKLHMCQYQEESEALEDIKHSYIDKFHKLPVTTESLMNYWTDISFTMEDIPAMVKSSLEEYYNWETSVLTNLLAWKKDCSHKQWFQKPIQNVMAEISRIETMMSILNEHDYNYECICELSDYLYRDL